MAKSGWLKQKYGITISDYNDMVIKQGGVCLICSGGEGKTLHVDHDHATGAVRGLLCGPCNRMLGCAKDSIENLIRGALYLANGDDLPPIYAQWVAELMLQAA